MKSSFYIALAFVLALFLSACGQNDDLSNALAASAQVTARNHELTDINGKLSTALSSERRKSAQLAVDLAHANKIAQAERGAKWLARNEVIGAKKVAEKAVVAAHSVGVKQGKPKLH